MKTNCHVLLAISATLVLAADVHAGRWLSRDPIEEGAGLVQRHPVEPIKIVFKDETRRNWNQYGRDAKASGYRNEPNLYAFVRNNPANSVDALGLSAVDVANILSIAISAFNELCDKNCRCDNGTLNNLGIVFLGKPWYGCGDQAKYEYLALKKIFTTDNKYKIDIKFDLTPGPHQYVTANPVEEGDPYIVIDAHGGFVKMYYYGDHVDDYEMRCKPKSVTHKVLPYPDIFDTQ